MTGINGYGFFEERPRRIEYPYEIPMRKRRRKYDFSKIYGEVPEGNRPWDV